MTIRVYERVSVKPSATPTGNGNDFVEIESLSLEQLENLGEALLDFTSMADLDAWLSGLGDHA
ncbi:hypothetical protein FDUTEX481_09460 [Tolypothrix sp. PCC 7601]|nr:hypothetical protein FDUTEX481_09460 [Tolypothrix sp. PCC 7601]BAY91135.1 hypothetical protein NIES3275_31570 [Microchaete diplosiphon NIES-3275]